MDRVAGQVDLYNGATPTYTPVAQQQMQAHTADYESGARAAGQLLDKGVKLIDYYQEMQEQEAQVKVETERAKDYQNRMAKAAGTAGSFLNKDGSVNTDELDKFNSQWAQRFRETRRMRLDGEDALRANAQREDTIRKWGQQTETQVNADMLKATRDIWETRMKIFEANGDTESMRAHVQRGLEAGLIRDDEAELMRIRMAKGAARGGGGGGRGRRMAGTRTVEQQRAMAQPQETESGTPTESNVKETDPAELTSTMGSMDAPAAKEQPLTYGEDVAGNAMNEAADKEFRTAMETAKENPFSDISLRTDGFRMLDSATFDEVREADVADLRRGSITLNPATGREVFEAPAIASDATFAIVDHANALDGYELPEYAQDLHKCAFRYAMDPKMAGMTKAALTTALKNDTTLESAAARWFDGDELAAEGWVQTELNKVLDVKDGAAFKHLSAQVQKINNVADVQNMVRSGVLHESFLRPADLEGAFDAVTSKHWWGGGVTANAAVTELWNTYGDAFLKENGKERGKGLDEHFSDFRKWALQKGGVVEQQQKQYATAVQDIVVTRITDAMTEYFANTAEADEAGAIAYTRERLKQPLTQAELGPQAAIAAERRKREDLQRAVAEKAVVEAAEAKERIQHYKTRGEDAKRAEKERAAQQNTAAKAAEQSAKAQQAEESKRRQKLASPMRQRVRWDGGNDDTPYATAPRAMFDELVETLGKRQILGLPATAGIGVRFADGSGRVIPVKAGDVPGVVFSHGALLQEWPHAGKAQLRNLCNGVNKTIKFLPY